MNVTPLPILRQRAVDSALDWIRDVVGRMGVTREMLAAIKPIVTDLASKTELFPAEHFPLPGGKSTIYRLAEDRDRNFALYASAGAPGKAQPPHNHTTWTVISGVFGEERNVFFDRVDDRTTPGRGQLQMTDEFIVRRGNACALMPDDYHSINVVGSSPSLHLHLYGRSLEDLPGRIFFPSSIDGECRTFPANPNITAPAVPAAELKAMLNDGDELALLDVREEGAFAKRHLLFASSLPLSRLEFGIESLVPRRTTRIVLCDNGDGLAGRAAAKLAHFGYRNVMILEGGVNAWQSEGYELFSGVNVPSKAFGELVEHSDRTPSIEPAALKAMIDKRDDFLVLDSRPLSEFQRMSIPGAINCPGAELVYRIHDLAPSPDTTVVVNCAGRTRSIIGAASLIRAGIPNRVFALRNGTMGWRLAGLALEHGQTAAAPTPSVEGLKKARAAAADIAQRFGVRGISDEKLATMQRDTDRTTYLLDVRSPEEYRAGHRADSRSAPGGQLVQALDTYVAVRNARLVLIDGDGVRASMTASWLIQMGLKDVYVLTDGLNCPDLVVGDEPRVVAGLGETACIFIRPTELRHALDEKQVTVIDLASSLEYRSGHIPEAVFAVRSRLAAAVTDLPLAGSIVLTSSDGVLARLAAPELARLTTKAVSVLEGGTTAWAKAGFALIKGAASIAGEPDDVWYRPYDRNDNIEQAMQAYLDWEIGLSAQIARDGDAKFAAAP